jgi:predicted alpha/beta superfamily hydrolase
MMTPFFQKNPVLYVLDGESHFDYAAGMTDFMSAAGVTNNYQIPEVIVVAIPNKEPGKDNRFRDYSPTQVRDYYSESGGGVLFLKFLRDEIVPRIESEYRTIPLRILAGHSMGGLITVYDLLNTPSIFNAYIAMDPSLWWDNQLLFSQAKSLAAGILRSPLYLSTYGKAQRKEESREFVATLAAKNSSPFRSKFQVFESEGHGSLPIVSLYNGLLFIFDGFRPDLNSLVDDPTAIGRHFSKFSQTLGVNFLPPEDLIHLVCNATVADNPKKAVDCFKVNVANYPSSYNAHNALAKICASKGMIDESISSYRRSLEIKPGNMNAVNGLKGLGGK